MIAANIDKYFVCLGTYEPARPWMKSLSTCPEGTSTLNLCKSEITCSSILFSLHLFGHFGVILHLKCLENKWKALIITLFFFQHGQNCKGVNAENLFLNLHCAVLYRSANQALSQ